MKKFIAFVTAILLLVATPTCAVATSDDDLSGLTDEIITTSNDLLSDKLSREITLDDIDYDKAFKIYVGVNLFNTDVDSLNQIPNTFGPDGYIYELPIYVDENTIIINIAKGHELNEEVEFTPEEKQSIFNNVGKWQVTAIKYYEGETIDYLVELQNIIGDVAEDAVLVGGLPHFRYAVALLPDDTGNISGLVPMSEVPGIENVDFCRSAKQGIYDYQQIKEYVNQLSASSVNEVSAYGFLEAHSPQDTGSMAMIVVVAIAVISVGTVVILYYRKMKHSSTFSEI